MSDGASMCPGCNSCRCGRKEHDAPEPEERCPECGEAVGGIFCKACAGDEEIAARRALEGNP
jgi:hypothetical protein